MRPILWATIWFFIGLVGWAYFSVIDGVGAGLEAVGLGASVPPFLMFLLYFFGVIFFFSLPIGGIFEFVDWRRAKRLSTTQEDVSSQGNLAQNSMPLFCPSCGQSIEANSNFCSSCGWHVVSLSTKPSAHVNSTGHYVMVVVLLLAVVLGVGFTVADGLSFNTGNSGNSQTMISKGTTYSLFPGELQGVSFALQVSSAKLVGAFSVSGAPVTFYITSQSQYEVDTASGSTGITQYLYSSGQVFLSDSFSLTLVSSGTYYLIFYNDVNSFGNAAVTVTNSFALTS